MSREAVDELGMIAARAAYVVDGDEAGQAIKRKLLRQGIPAERIIEIRQGDEGLCLEDLLHPGTHIAALNEGLRRSHGEHVQILREALPESGRPAAVDRWCEDQGIDPPSKPAVANRILERDVSMPLVEHRRQALIRRLNDQLTRLLN